MAEICKNVLDGFGMPAEWTLEYGMMEISML